MTTDPTRSESTTHDHIGPHHEPDTTLTKLKFSQFFPIVEASIEDGRQWIHDFGNDEILIPSDLHDIITAFEHFSSDRPCGPPVAE